MTGEDEPFGAGAEFLAVEAAHSHTLHRAQSFVGLDLDDIGIRIEVDVGRLDDVVAVPRAEAGRRTELPHLGLKRRRVGEERNALGVAVFPVAGLVLVGSELENLLRAWIERIEILASNRPATVWDPVA